MIYLIIAMAGIWMIQDGFASIFWYRNGSENWHNHIWRVARAGWGIVLVILAITQGV